MLSAYRRPIYFRRYLLSQNPEAEERIVAELRELGLLATPEQPHPRALEYTDLAKLTSLNNALKVRSPPHTVHTCQSHRYRPGKLLAL